MKRRARIIKSIKIICLLVGLLLFALLVASAIMFNLLQFTGRVFASIGLGALLFALFLEVFE